LITSEIRSFASASPRSAKPPLDEGRSLAEARAGDEVIAVTNLGVQAKQIEEITGEPVTA